MRSTLSASILTKSLEQSPEAFKEQWDHLTPQQQAESFTGLAHATADTPPLVTHWDELAPSLTALLGAALEQALGGHDAYGLGYVWANQDPVSLLKAARSYTAQLPPPGPKQTAAQRAITWLPS